MIWIAFAVMTLAATAIVARPIYKRDQRITPGLVAAVGIVVAVSSGVYWNTGMPVAPTAEESVESMLTLLEQRVAQQPAEIESWKMLGRFHLAHEDYTRAIPALQRAVELELAADAETLIDLGEAVLNEDESTITGRAGDLFEKALNLEPVNPRGLFYGGVAARARGERVLAVYRWERLLAHSPPPELEPMLKQGIAEWRGNERTESQARPEPATPTEPVVQVNVSIGRSASGQLEPDSTVFIIARDPARPSPPIAVVKRTVAELPLTVALGDEHSMLAGRQLSAFERLEVVARASPLGDPAQQPGDWFGRAIVVPADSRTVDIVIEREIP